MEPAILAISVLAARDLWINQICFALLPYKLGLSAESVRICMAYTSFPTSFAPGQTYATLTIIHHFQCHSMPTASARFQLPTGGGNCPWPRAPLNT